MHPIFSISLFTGQQLILEAIQRWLARPCTDAESQRQRRLGLKGLLSLLVKTTATGVLATVLDAAIEFRRRQLLAAAAADPADGAFGGPSSFPGLGMLSRAGITSWKSRLLLGIDELERRAEAYGIESRHRFSPSKLPANQADSDGIGGKAGLPRHASSQELDDAERSERLGRTVAQLQSLVKKADSDSQQRRVDEEVGSLLDLLLGTSTPLPSPPRSPAAAGGTSSTSSAAAACRSRSMPAALNCMDRREAGGDGGGMRACHSRASLEDPGSLSDPGSSGSSEVCQICMDSLTNVQVSGCQHDLCFGCARRLCATDDHSVPQCPFCRQPIDGFIGSRTSKRSDDWTVGAGTSTAMARVQ